MQVCKPSPFLEQCYELPRMWLAEYDQVFLAILAIGLAIVLLLWITGKAK